MSPTDWQSSKVHELSSLQNQTNSARSRLVQSPDRIKRNITQMTHDVTQEKSSLARYQQQVRSHQSRLDVFGSLERDLKELIDLEKGIELQKAKVEEARRAQSMLQAKLEGKVIEGQGLNSKLQVRLFNSGLLASLKEAFCGITMWPALTDSNWIANCNSPTRSLVDSRNSGGKRGRAPKHA